MAHYDNKNFTRKDVVNISLDTTKEDGLFNYVGVEKEYVRMKHSELDYGSKEKDEKKFELSLQFFLNVEIVDICCKKILTQLEKNGRIDLD